MWRGVYNEDWERWREITTRALFHDIPLLSPVPEEDDSQNGLSVHVSPSSIKTWKPIDDANRPRSPLPPLVIEREPNRHDEPEEYYQKLTRKMKKIYRMLFIENRSLDTSFEHSTNGSLYSYSHLEVDLSTPLDSSAKTDKHSPHKDQNTEMNSIDQTQNKQLEKTFQSSDVELASNGEQTNKRHEHIEKDSVSDITQESPGLSSTDHYVQVTFQADVHKEPSMREDTSLAYEYRASEEAASQCDDAPLKRTVVSDIITRSTSVHLHIKEMEVMRTPRDSGPRTSFDTLLQQPHEASNDHLSPEAARYSFEDHNPFDILKESSPTQIEQCSDDFNITLQSSTPKIATKRRIGAENVSDDYWTFSRPKRIRYDSVATQCDNLSEWSSLRANFFVGTPNFFKLCSCKDHRCEC